jgi:hypothetical protein
MTVCAVLASLVPLLRESGIGSDVMKPIAALIVGSMITSTIHVLIPCARLLRHDEGTGAEARNTRPAGQGFLLNQQRLGSSIFVLRRSHHAIKFIAPVAALCLGPASPFSQAARTITYYWNSERPYRSGVHRSHGPFAVPKKHTREESKKRNLIPAPSRQSRNASVDAGWVQALDRQGQDDLIADLVIIVVTSLHLARLPKG